MASLGLTTLTFEKESVAFSYQCQKFLVGDKLQTLYLLHFLFDAFWMEENQLQTPYLLHFLFDSFWMVDVSQKPSYPVQVKNISRE